MTQSNSNPTIIEINGKIILHCDWKFGAQPSFRPLRTMSWYAGAQPGDRGVQRGRSHNINELRISADEQCQTSFKFKQLH